MRRLCIPVIYPLLQHFSAAVFSVTPVRLLVNPRRPLTIVKMALFLYPSSSAYQQSEPVLQACAHSLHGLYLRIAWWVIFAVLKVTTGILIVLSWRIIIKLIVQTLLPPRFPGLCPNSVHFYIGDPTRARRTTHAACCMHCG